jgi:hypothetical protein
MRAAFDLGVVGIDFDVHVRQSLDISELGLVVGGRSWLGGDDDRTNPDTSALALEPVSDQHGAGTARYRSRRTAAADLMRLYAHSMITIIPRNPAVGSSQGKPK